MLESGRPGRPDFGSILEEDTLSANHEQAIFDAGVERTNVGGASASIWTRLTPYRASDLVGGSAKQQTTEKENLTILSVDIRGFTSLAEGIDPEECVHILNGYFDVAVELVLDSDGEVDKFQGDGFMAIFTGTRRGESHEHRAVRCALRLRDMAWSLNLPRVGSERIPIGIGINTGVAAFAHIGSRMRSDYTVIGDVVNVAHYLQRISGPDQIIISRSTQQHIGTDFDCAPLGFIRVKKRISRVEAFVIE